MGRRSGVTSAETRQDLLDATVHVLLTKGYAGARISEIAQAAGVTPGSIYNHFSSKAELLTAAVTERGPNLIGDVIRAEGRGPLLEDFRRIVSLLPETGRVMGPLLMEFVAAAGRDPKVAEVVIGELGAREAAATALLRRARDEGEVDPALDVRALSRFVTMVVLGSLVVGALDLKPVDGQAWDRVVERLLGAVRPRRDNR